MGACTEGHELLFRQAEGNKWILDDTVPTHFSQHLFCQISEIKERVEMQSNKGGATASMYPGADGIGPAS